MPILSIYEKLDNQAGQKIRHGLRESKGKLSSKKVKHITSNCHRAFRVFVQQGARDQN